MRMFALFSLLAVAGASCGAPAAPKWEYSIASPSDDDLQQQLKMLGAAGWEIVSARRATSSEPGRPAASYEMILKRPISDKDAADILAAPPVPK